MRFKKICLLAMVPFLIVSAGLQASGGENDGGDGGRGGFCGGNGGNGGRGGNGGFYGGNGEQVTRV